MNLPTLKKSSSSLKEEPLNEMEQSSKKLHRSNTMEVKKHQKTEKYSHLLIAKVKDSQIMFSFFIEASIVEQTDKTPMF
jgi:hypothetical protein